MMLPLANFKRWNLSVDNKTEAKTSQPWGTVQAMVTRSVNEVRGNTFTKRSQVELVKPRVIIDPIRMM